MKRFYLIECYPSGNHSVGDCIAWTKKQAIDILQGKSPITLDEEGYAKLGDSTFVVGESFHPA